MKNTYPFLIRRTIYKVLYLFDQLMNNETKLFVLCYHGIDEKDWRFSVSFETFKQQITYLKNQRYAFITTSDVIAYLQGKKILPKKSVCLTFDDGYKSMMTIAPFLKKEKIKPTLFLLANTKNPNWKEIGKKDTFLNVSEIKLLEKNGWIMGCHSSTHANLARLSETDLTKEITQAKKQLEQKLRKPIIEFAYPRGKYTDTVVKKVEKAGFTSAWTMDDALLTSQTNLLKIPRIGVDRSHSFSEFKTLFTPSAITFRQIIKATWVGGLL